MKPHQFLGQDIDIPFITLRMPKATTSTKTWSSSTRYEDPVTLPYGS
jgi:hypothetical protein